MQLSSTDQLCALLRGAMPPEDGFDRLASAATRHRVHGLLFHQLAGRSTAAAVRLREALRPAVHRSISLSAHQDSVTAQLFAEPRGLDIPFLVFKGTPLAHQIYPAPHLRPRADVDLLVDPAHSDILRDWLIARGYDCGPLVKPLSRGIYLASQFNATSSAHADCPHVLDVHWQVNNRYALSASWPFEMLYQQSRIFDQLGPALRCPSALHALLIACLHWTGEPDRKLIWLYDIHLLASRLDTASSHELLDLAAQTRLQTVLEHLLRQCRARFATPLPPPLLQVLARPPAGPRGDPTRLLLHRPGSAVTAHVADFLSIRKPRECARMLSAVLFPPSSYLDLQGVAPGLPLPLRHAVRISRPLWSRFSRR